MLQYNKIGPCSESPIALPGAYPTTTLHRRRARGLYTIVEAHAITNVTFCLSSRLAARHFPFRSGILSLRRLDRCGEVGAVVVMLVDGMVEVSRAHPITLLSLGLPLLCSKQAVLSEVASIPFSLSVLNSVPTYQPHRSIGACILLCSGGENCQVRLLWLISHHPHQELKPELCITLAHNLLYSALGELISQF